MGHTQAVTQCFIAAPASWPLFILPVQQFSSCWPCWDTWRSSSSCCGCSCTAGEPFAGPILGQGLSFAPHCIPVGWLVLGHGDLLSVSRVCGALGPAGAALAHRKPHAVGSLLSRRLPHTHTGHSWAVGALWMCRISPGLPLLKLFGLFVVLPPVPAVPSAKWGSLHHPIHHPRD